MKASYFSLKYQGAEFLGVRINEENKACPVGLWHTLTESLKDFPHFPLNDLETFHLSCEAPIIFSSRPLNENNGDIKVGIQIPRETDDKDLPFKTLIEFIDILRTDANYFPILLFDPNDFNDDYPGKINRYFDNEIEIINTNYLNLTKIIPLLDSFITSKEALKNLAQRGTAPYI